jgi:DNA-binding response OmpR family regulator
MPRKDGLNLLSDLKDLGNVIPVLILTASDDSRNVALVKTAGANAFLKKPFKPKELIHAVAKIISNRQHNKLG